MGFTFRTVVWNFSEAGHGKGAPDGIGATVKSAGDALAAHGVDVADALTLFKELKSKDFKVQLHYIAHSDIPSQEVQIPMVLKPVVGTMKVHQLFTNTPGTISHRVLSCYCSHPYSCECYSPKTVQFGIGTSTSIPHPQSLAPIPVPGEMLSKSTTAATPQTMPGTSKVGGLSSNDHDGGCAFQTATAVLSTRPTNPRASSTPTLSACSLASVVPGQPDMVGKWCDVVYDGQPYPGIINACDDELEVKTMVPVGKNRFIWPIRTDMVWYECVLGKGLIPEPQKVSSRRDIVQISPNAWSVIQDMVPTK
jgi:hypothetical protein